MTQDVKLDHRGFPINIGDTVFANIESQPFSVLCTVEDFTEQKVHLTYNRGGQTYHCWKSPTDLAVDVELRRNDLLEEIDRLRLDCAEAYQAVGVLAGDNITEGIDKLMDNLHAASQGDPRPHDDLLPFTG